MDWDMDLEAEDEAEAEEAEEEEEAVLLVSLVHDSCPGPSSTSKE
jgi:hypothetical protein